MAIRVTQQHCNLIVPRILFRSTQVGCSLITFVGEPPEWFRRRASRPRVVRTGIL